MSTALPAVPRRPTDLLGSDGFRIVDRYQFGDGYVHRETAELTIRTAPDGPPIDATDIDDTVAWCVECLRAGRWRDAEYAVRSIRGKQVRERSEPDGPALSRTDAAYVMRVVTVHLASLSSVNTAGNSLRGWKVRGEFCDGAIVDGESDLSAMELPARTHNTLEQVWQGWTRPRTIDEVAVVLDEWCAVPTSQPRYVRASDVAYIREELMRLDLLGPVQRAYLATSGGRGKQGKLKAMQTKGEVA